MSRVQLHRTRTDDADLRQIAEALDQIRDPFARYAFAMIVGQIATQLAEILDAGHHGTAVQTLTPAADVANKARERVAQKKSARMERAA